jgi:tetratricopeptide (TPR) repeat protein
MSDSAAKDDSSKVNVDAPSSGNDSAARHHQDALDKAKAKAASSETKAKGDDEGGEDLSAIFAEESAAEADLAAKRASLGIEHPDTIRAAIRMLESWILLYKLKPMDDLIAEVLPTCEKLAEESGDNTLYVKVLQLKAFMRYKQFKHREALNLFYTFKDIVGASPELLENIGHTHNHVGEHDKALTCFKDALQIYDIREKLDPNFNRDKYVGGTLLGIGTTYKALRDYPKALDYMQQALEVYKRRTHGEDHSLIAKTLSGLGSVQTLQGAHEDAHRTHVECVRIFKVTCGLSPLTANALFDLACAAKQVGLPKEAATALDESLDMHVDFDTLDMPKIIMVANTILEVRPTLIGKPFPTERSPVLTLNAAFAGYSAMLERCAANMAKQGIDADDNAAVFYKACGEILVLGGHHMEAVKMLNRAATHFKSVTFLDCSGLVKQCEELAGIALNLHLDKSSGKKK